MIGHVRGALRWMQTHTHGAHFAVLGGSAVFRASERDRSAPKTTVPLHIHTTTIAIANAAITATANTAACARRRSLHASQYLGQPMRGARACSSSALCDEPLQRASSASPQLRFGFRPASSVRCSSFHEHEGDRTCMSSYPVCSPALFLP